jgi:excisionase family DNA binding protein
MTITLREDCYTPAEVAALFRVDPRTITKWAQSGALEYFRTPGGHRRYPASAIQKMLDGQ